MKLFLPLNVHIAYFERMVACCCLCCWASLGVAGCGGTEVGSGGAAADTIAPYTASKQTELDISLKKTSSISEKKQNICINSILKNTHLTAELTNMDSVMQHKGLSDVQAMYDGFAVDMRYASTHNFVGKNMYGSLTSCYLQPEVAQMLVKAASYLHHTHPHYRLLLLDCARPLRVQRQMWEVVRGTDKQKYVASPQKHSIHNYGVAVDLTIADSLGNELDMGTPYDHLGWASQPRYHTQLLAKHILTEQQVQNRTLLRQAMVQAGFRPIGNEWWHFDAYSLAVTKRRFTLIE